MAMIREFVEVKIKELTEQEQIAALNFHRIQAALLAYKQMLDEVEKECCPDGEEASKD